MATEVELPDGTIVEFPDGTSRDVMESAIRNHLGRSAHSGPPIFRSGPTVPLQNGMPMSQAIGRQDFPELPLGYRNMTDEQALDMARNQLKNPDPNASIGQDTYGNRTLTMHGQQHYFNKPGFNSSDLLAGFNRFTDAAEEVAPYIASGVATAPAKALPAIAAQAATGFLEESADQTVNAMRGERFDWGEVGKMSLTAAAGEGMGRFIVGGISRLLSALPGKSTVQVLNKDGTLTDDAINTLRQHNVTPAQADDAIKQALTSENVLTPEQANRFNLFQKYGLEGTKAQVMRTADEFQAQQELLKKSGRMRNALENQRVRIHGMMGEAAESGRPAGYSAYEAITNKALQLDEEISDLYRVADDAARGGKFVRLENYTDGLRKNAGQNRISNGLINALKSDLQERGIINDNWQVVGRVDAKTAEEIRKGMNALHNSTTDRGRQLLKQFKERLDADVFRAAGDDVYQRARQAKASFEQGLSREKINKFDTRTNSLVRDVLENKINPDEFFEKTVLSSARRASDLEDLKVYLNSGTEDQIEIGADAWETLRRDTMNYIKEQAFKSQYVGEQGIPEFSADKMQQALRRIGTDKMRILFRQDEMSFLSDMLKIAKARTPIDRTDQGLGPSGQVGKYVVDKFADLATNGHSGLVVPILGDILDYLRTNPVLNPAKDIVKTVEKVGRASQTSTVPKGIRAIGSPASVFAADR